MTTTGMECFSTANLSPSCFSMASKMVRPSVAQLADKLPGVGGAAGYLNEHPMVDLTGLKGSYDFHLEWNPKEPGALVKAVQQRLGLKLSKQRRKISVVSAEPKP